MNFAAAYDTNGGTNSDNYNAGAKSCSAISCHGAGTPVWGGAALACDQCHLANNTLAGKHSKHYGVATVAVTADKTASNTSSGTAYEYSCGVCHNATPHADGNVSANQAAQVAFDGTIAVGGTYAAGAFVSNDTGTRPWTNGSCSATYCHSQGASTASPFGGAPNTVATWNGAALTCEGCHNFNAAATNKMATGKHTVHINDGTIMTNVACSACHVSTTSDSTTITNEANHVNKLKDVTIAATYDSDATPANNWASNQCSSVYCHSSGEATPSYKTILWTATITNCEGCHNYDAAATNKMSTGNHTEHINNASVIATNYGCQECHNTTTTNGTSITTPANHIDKTRNVSMLKGGSWTSPNCSSVYCHSSGQATPSYRTVPAWGSATDLTCDGCHGTEGGTAYGEPAYVSGGAGVATANSHTAHVAVAADCTRCHIDTVDAAGTAIKAGSTLHTNQTRNVNFAAAYDTNGGTNSDNYNAGAKSCSAISCHGAGTPVWGGAALACDQCHLANNTLAGKHSKHYGVATVAVTADKTASNTSSGTAYEYSCGVCHNATPHADGNVSANQAAQVAFDGTIAVGGTYAAGAFVSNDTGTRPWTNGSCSATYCHSQGASTASPFGGAPNTVATWNGAALTCEGCHNFNAAATNKMATGSHTEHINNSSVIATNYGCQECHNTTTSDGTTITNEANHVNKTRDVSMVKGGAWVSPNCSSVYCHSTGQATMSYVTVPAWGSATDLTCDGCHGTEGGTAFGEPAYANGTQPAVVENNDNSHAAHVTVAADCAKCHTDTVEATGTAIKTGSTLHTNQVRNVNFAATYDKNGGTNADNYNTGTKTCSAISCHGAGTPMWGANTTYNTCTKCHGTGTTGTVDGTNRYVVAPPTDIAGNSGTYSDIGQVSNDPQVGAHQTHLRIFNGLTSTTGQFTLDNRCEFCHGTLPTLSTHANGTAAPVFSGLATTGGMSASYAGGACTNTYCHNPAGTNGSLLSANTGSATAPSWTNAAYIGDTAGKTQAKCGVCHKSPGDIGFQPAATHNLMDVSTDCKGCHGHNGDNLGIVGQRHMDGVKYGGGNCDSCHAYDVVGATYTSGVWNGGTWTHSTARDVIGQGWGAHVQHINHIKTRLSIATVLDPVSQTFGVGFAGKRLRYMPYEYRRA